MRTRPAISRTGKWRSVCPAMLWSALLIWALTSLSTRPALAQNRGSTSEMARIIALENAWNGAEVSHDIRSLEMLIADSFVYTDSDGSFLDKNQWLTQIKNETDQYQQLANAGMRVYLYENAAVVTGEYSEKIQIKGKFVLRSGRFTDTWVRRNSEWKCVASQATLIVR